MRDPTLPRGGGWVDGWVAEPWLRPKLGPPPPGSLSNSLPVRDELGMWVLHWEALLLCVCLCVCCVLGGEGVHTKKPPTLYQKLPHFGTKCTKNPPAKMYQKKTQNVPKTPLGGGGLAQVGRFYGRRSCRHSWHSQGSLMERRAPKTTAHGCGHGVSGWRKPG